MNKLWRVISGLALLCLVFGLVGIGFGFFSGSSPVTIQQHGNLTEYVSRLEINRDVLLDYIAQARVMLGI